MKKVLIVLFSLFFLCGCGGRKGPSNQDDAVTLQQPGSTQEEKEIPSVTVTEYPLPEEVAALAKLDIKDMVLYADEEQSRRNSNQLNFGNFTSDEYGNIYFVDYTQKAVYMCGPEGENKELIYEGIGEYLHIVNGELYFVGIDTETMRVENIIRINPETKEAETLYEGACGEITIIQDILYNNISGMARLKLNAGDGKFTGLSEIECVFFNSDGRYLLYNMVNENSRFLFERGYLLAWDTETETNYFVESKMIFPLLAGNWLSYFDLWTNTRHVLDMETGTDTDLTGYIQRAASDGHKLYWARQEAGGFRIMQWDGVEIQELLKVDGEEQKDGDVFLYLTEDYLYWMWETKFLEEAEWGYYRLSDGKTGSLHAEG